MDWTALRDFVAVAEHGSLSAASRILHLSQPTLGRHIEQLEQQLNAQLFHRSTTGLTLTDTGEQILLQALRMQEAALGIERIASGANQRLEGTVRITLTDLMGNVWLPARLPEFYRRYPGLRIEIAVDNRNLDLIRREADIAIRFARPEQLDLVTRQSIAFHYGLYGSRRYLDSHGTPESLRDLAGHKFISYDELVFRIPGLQRLEKLFGEQNIVTRSTSSSGILEAIIHGVGLGVIGCYFADRESELVRLLPERFNIAFPAWVITHTDIYKSARIKAVFDFLVEMLAQDRLLFRGQAGNG